MNIGTKLYFGYIQQINTLLGLLCNRILFTALALSILVCLILLVRKKLAPNLRSRLWGLCIPALLIPFEHGIVTIARSFYTPDSTPENALNLLPYLWLAGFIVFVVKTRNNRNNTMRLLKSGALNECAAYFYKGRSRIYLPPDFEKTYTSVEREMLLAHENQHITQHDPILYRFLQTMQCVFWFNPLVHMAACSIRHDRELLCDERVIQNCSKREYGLLLLREAQKKPMRHILPGIASETGGIYERVSACVKPFSENKKPAIIITVIAAAIFAVGFMGYLKPIVSTPMDIWVSIERDGDFSHLENAEKYVLLKPDGIALDQNGLFEHSLSLGIEPEQKMVVSMVGAERLTLTGEYTVRSNVSFTVAQLKTEDIFFPYYDAGFKLWGMLYKLL